MQVKKIKDWLKERSEKYQFEINVRVDGETHSVRRLYDGVKFTLSDKGLFLNTGHKIEKIICFFWDKIHVDVLVEGRDHQELIEINEISLAPLSLQLNRTPYERDFIS